MSLLYLEIICPLIYVLLTLIRLYAHVKIPKDINTIATKLTQNATKLMHKMPSLLKVSKVADDQIWKKKHTAVQQCKILFIACLLHQFIDSSSDTERFAQFFRHDS